MSTYTLPGDQAWRKVCEEDTGRIVTTADDGTPDVYPVSYATNAGRILVRTRLGTKFRNMARHPDTVFEVDGTDPASHTAWSVVVRALATIERAAASAQDVEALRNGPRVDIPADELVVLVPYRVSGREFPLRRRVS